MKILVISNYFAIHRGGVEVVAGELARQFADEGHDVVWMAGETNLKPEPVGQVRIIPLPIWNCVENRTGVPFPMPFVSGLKALLGAVRDAEVLILHDCLYLANIFAFLAAKRSRIPTVIVQHTRYFPGSSRLLNAIMRAGTAWLTHPMLRHAAQVIFIGKTTMGTYQHLHFKRPPELIYNGVNTDVFRARGGEDSIPSLRGKYGIPQNRRVILFVGRFIEKKGLFAIKLMATLRPEYFWALVGRGPIEPQRWGLDNVRVLSGLDDPSVADLYRCCDLLALPSFGEGGFPLVVREALVSGLRVVCGEETLGADPSMADLVTGAPVIVGDDARTAEAFLTLIDATLVSGLRTSADSEKLGGTVESRLSWKHVARLYLNTIFRVVAESRTRASHLREAAETERS